MTTEVVAEQFDPASMSAWCDRNYAAYNPRNKPVDELPFIYGFNNGGQEKFLHAVLLSSDGVFLGDHCCSHEIYMPGDLGVLFGSRPDRHERFRLHYPDGYRMEFVPYDRALKHEGLIKALEMNAKLRGEEQ